jgi:OPA family glycerol-3-phosphate transporter-like MFS transporter
MQSNPTTFRKAQWQMLLITMFCYLFFYTGRHNFGWASKHMAADLHFSYEMIGWISLSMLIGYAIGQFINGNLADHWSPRVMIPVGALLSVGTNFLISYASSFNTILILWTCNGFFQSMAWAPGSKLISNWWSAKEKGKAFGFYTMAAGSSSAVTFLLSILLIQQGAHWRTLFRIPVLFLLVASVCFYIIARNKPADKGFNNLDTKEDDTRETNWRERYTTVLSNKMFLVTCLAMGFQSMARYGLIFWVPTHFLGSNYKSDPNNLWVSLLLPIGMATGAFSFGRISDTLFKRNRPASIRVGMLASAGISLLIYLAPAGNIPLGIVLMFAAGFFVYGPQSNFWTMSPEILGEKYVGTGIGIMNMTAYLFAALGEPLLGKLIDLTHNTSVIFIAVACISAACAVVISFINYDKIRTNEHTYSVSNV